MQNNIPFPTQKMIGRIKKLYPSGCRVELVQMDDPYSKLAPGERGTVNHVDDAGTVFVNWDCGSDLGIVYGVDRITKL